MVALMAASAAGTMISQRQQVSAQNKTNREISARYAEEARKQREGKKANAALAEQVEAKRQDRLDSNKNDADKLRDFTAIAGAEDQELRQGVQIEGPTGADTNA